MACLLLALPAEAALTLHVWCHGDLNNEPIADPGSLTPMVAFANGLSNALRTAGRRIPPIHAALADGNNPPTVAAACYEPLRKLDPDVPFIAGLIDERHPTRTAAALQLVEEALDRAAFAVAAPCGLGRRSPTCAEANLVLAHTLAVTSGQWRRPFGPHHPYGRLPKHAVQTE